MLWPKKEKEEKTGPNALALQALEFSLGVFVIQFGRMLNQKETNAVHAMDTGMFQNG